MNNMGFDNFDRSALTYSMNGNTKISSDNARMITNIVDCKNEGPISYHISADNIYYKDKKLSEILETFMQEKEKKDDLRNKLKTLRRDYE